ncbi:hypothetical protein EON80_09420 [bacterium]|nr:MAG: hypothetical protein EON80_09420 [bacterium]
MIKKFVNFTALLLGLLFVGIVTHQALLHRARRNIIGEWRFKDKTYTEVITFYRTGVVEWDLEYEPVPGSDTASSYPDGHLMGIYAVTGKNTVIARKEFYRSTDKNLHVYPELNSGVAREDMQLDFIFSFGPGDIIQSRSGNPKWGGLPYTRVKSIIKG